MAHGDAAEMPDQDNKGWAHAVGATTEADVLSALAIVHSIASSPPFGGSSLPTMMCLPHKHPVYQNATGSPATDASRAATAVPTTTDRTCGVCGGDSGALAWNCVAAACNHVECDSCHAATLPVSTAAPRAALLWQRLVPLLADALCLARHVEASRAHPQQATSAPTDRSHVADTDTLSQTRNSFKQNAGKDRQQSDLLGGAPATVIVTSESSDDDGNDADVDKGAAEALRKHTASMATTENVATTARRAGKRPRMSSPAREAVTAAVGGPSSAGMHAQASKVRKQSLASRPIGSFARGHSVSDQVGASRRGRGVSDAASGKHRGRRGDKNGFERIAEALKASHNAAEMSDQDRAFMEEARAQSAAYEAEVSTPNSAMGALRFPADATTRDQQQCTHWCDELYCNARFDSEEALKRHLPVHALNVSIDTMPTSLFCSQPAICNTFAYFCKGAHRRHVDKTGTAT